MSEDVFCSNLTLAPSDDPMLTRIRSPERGSDHWAMLPAANTSGALVSRYSLTAIPLSMPDQVLGKYQGGVSIPISREHGSTGWSAFGQGLSQFRRFLPWRICVRVCRQRIGRVSGRQSTGSDAAALCAAL